MKLEEKLLSTAQKQLVCKDYLVSHRSFDLMFNKEFNLLITSPIPENLSEYYESEEYISHAEEGKGLIALLYNLVRDYSLKRKEKLIAKFGLEKRLLDVGTGTGSFLNFCRKKGWETVGTEPSDKARKIAQESGLNIVSELSDVDDENFSIITLWHVLEHIPNLSETIQLLKEKLSNNGRLIVAVPNFKSWDANYYKEFWAAYDVPRHVWHFSRDSISKIFSEFTMEIEQVVPMKFDSYYVSLLSEKHKTGKSNLIRAFFNGLRSNLKAKHKNNYSSLVYVIKKA